MRLSVLLLAMVCAGAIGIAAPRPQDQDDVRGAFLTSRPKEKPATPETATRPSRKRPKPVVTNNPTKSPEKKTNDPASTKGTTAPPADTKKPINVPRLGLGLTLFTRDSNGLALRADPEHVFHRGDRVRVLLETNSDGYLYIFNTTNDGPVVMVYPDQELDEGGNYVQAHVPFEIPSSTSEQERLRWLAFDEFPGTERLYFVFTREPLNGVPIEDELIAFCRTAGAICPWRPGNEVWELVQKQMQEPLKTDNNGRFGRVQTAPEQEASTRGLSLAKDDPQPSLIMMASAASPMLVATLDLIHK